MSDTFTNQQQRRATAEECKARWGGHGPGVKFRCYLCGYKFKVGDLWRWVFANGRGGGGGGNFMVCEKCDRPNAEVIARWDAAYAEARQRFWYLFEDLAETNRDISREANVSFDAGYDEGYREGRREEP